jgi:hypothetical protein
LAWGGNDKVFKTFLQGKIDVERVRGLRSGRGVRGTQFKKLIKLRNL